MAMLNKQRVIKANPFLWEQLQTFPWFIDLVSLPSGKLTKNYGKLVYLYNMVIFHSYISLPEGIVLFKQNTMETNRSRPWEHCSLYLADFCGVGHIQKL